MRQLSNAEFGLVTGGGAVAEVVVQGVRFVCEAGSPNGWTGGSNTAQYNQLYSILAGPGDFVTQCLDGLRTIVQNASQKAANEQHVNSQFNPANTASTIVDSNGNIVYVTTDGTLFVDTDNNGLVDLHVVQSGSTVYWDNGDGAGWRTGN